MQRLTAEQSQQCHPPIICERVDVLLPVRLADEVDDDVYALPACDLLHLVRKVLRLVVHGMGGAARKAEHYIQLLAR